MMAGCVCLSADVKPPHHEAEQGTAFACAGRIEMSVDTDGCVRRFSVPEFSHGQWLETVAVRMFEQFWCSTFSGPSWRDESLPAKYFSYTAAFTQGIMNYESGENPFLKMVGQFCSLIFITVNQVLVLFKWLFDLVDLAFPLRL